MTTEYISISQAARKLGVGYNTIKREIHEGNLGFTTVRGMVRIHIKNHLSPYLKRNARRAKARRPF